MQRRVRILLAATVAAGALAAPAGATIHPIMLGWVCGNASGDPPGQTPGENHSDQSTLRALNATGVISDLTLPPSKFTTFDPATETGTSDSPAAANCTNSNQ
jgi:hypothetical protein